MRKTAAQLVREIKEWHEQATGLAEQNNRLIKENAELCARMVEQKNQSTLAVKALAIENDKLHVQSFDKDQLIKGIRKELAAAHGNVGMLIGKMAGLVDVEIKIHPRNQTVNIVKRANEMAQGI